MPLFKCNNGDEAPDLWSEYELGGACPARHAGYWERRRIEGKNIKRGKKMKLRLSDIREQFTNVVPAVRKHPNRIN